MAHRSSISERAAFVTAIGFGVFAIMGASIIAAAPRASSPVAVLAAPWAGSHGALGIIAAADSRVVSPGRYEWIAVAFDDRPDLTERLYRGGAIFIVDAAFASACINFTNMKGLGK